MRIASNPWQYGHRPMVQATGRGTVFQLMSTETSIMSP